MRFRVLALGLVALAVLVAAGVVGATSTAVLRGHAAASASSTAAAANPLDPLTADEIQRTFTTIEHAKNLAPATFFPIVKLSEPSKSFMQGWSPGQSFPRKAFANVFDRNANKLYEATVDLKTNKLDSYTQKVGTQPAVFFTEYAEADALVHAYAPWKKAMRDRGLDPNDVYVDTWAGPDTSNAAPAGTRILKALAFYRGALPNPYDRPIEGVVVTMDMNKLKVVDFVDTGIRPVDTTTTGSASSQRTDLKNLVVRQPDGASFTIDGRDVSWQGWRFRVDWSPREGVQLNRIGYEQNGVVRSIINRMSLSEIYVPYAIPDANWSWRSAFDVGEYNLGEYSESLQKNVDVPENAVFFDAVAAGDTGSGGGSYEIPGALAMYERDGGSLWDRMDPTSLERDARYARELVVTWAAAIGNYTYGVEYVFRMNGSIDVNVNATGTTLNQGIGSASQGNLYGTVVTPKIAAPGHQHFFDFRIDFDVDGTSNRVVEENVASTASPGGNAWKVQETTLNSEGSRDANASSMRSWKIESATKTNAVGEPTAYELEASDTGIPYSSPSYPPLLQAPFAQHPFWVTRYKDGELYAGGDYPFQGSAGDGLTAYASSENVNAKDVVVWYTVAITHMPHVEEYPVMTTHSAHFRIEPDGFFNSNPALDAPNQ